jgi:hypothetical protein
VYEFVQKLVKKDLHPGWDFNLGPKWLATSQRHAIHHPIASISGHFIYILYNKITIRKMRLYKFIHVAYSHPLHNATTCFFTPKSTTMASAGTIREEYLPDGGAQWHLG